MLLHENEKEIYGDVPGRCLDIVESVGSPALRPTRDPADVVQCGARPFGEGYEMLRPYVDHIQIKDAIAATGEAVPVGTGDGEVTQTLAALRADGFAGCFSLEPHLAQAHARGGFRGPELFATAHAAFTGLLREQDLPFRWDRPPDPAPARRPGPAPRSLARPGRRPGRTGTAAARAHPQIGQVRGRSLRRRPAGGEVLRRDPAVGAPLLLRCGSAAVAAST